MGRQCTILYEVNNRYGVQYNFSFETTGHFLFSIKNQSGPHSFFHWPLITVVNTDRACRLMFTYILNTCTFPSSPSGTGRYGYANTVLICYVPLNGIKLKCSLKNDVLHVICKIPRYCLRWGCACIIKNHLTHEI